MDLELKKVKETHNKKLIGLGANNINQIDADKVIFNFSDKFLSNEEKEILKYGLKFSLQNLNSLIISCRLKFLRNPTQISKITGDDKTAINNKVKALAHESFKYKDSLSQNSIKLFNINILENLMKDKSIIITRPDKGNGVVILNKRDYIDKNRKYFE